MSNDDTQDALAGRSLLLVGGGAVARAVAEAALARGMRLVMLLTDDDEGRESAARFEADALALFGSVGDDAALHAAIAAATTPSGLDAVIEIAFTADDGRPLLASRPAFLSQDVNALCATLRLAQATAHALRANAGTLVSTLTPAAQSATPGCGGVHAVAQRARAALIERLGAEVGGGVSVYGLCVPLPPRLAPPPRNLVAPVFQPEPSIWADDFLQLIDPTTVRPPSGSVVAVSAPAAIDGLVTLAGN